MCNFIKYSLLILAGLLFSPHLYAATEQDVENTFYPYKNGVPTHPDMRVGMVIAADNVDSVRDILDEASYNLIKEGALTIKVGETQDLILHQNYIDATLEHLNKARLGEKNGQIIGFIAGRPFPEEPRLDDPRAGEKLANNYKYGYNWGDNAAVYPEYWKFHDMKTGKLERTMRLHFNFLNYKHRVNKAQPPVPDLPNNPSQIFRGIYVQVMEPFDVKNTQLLIHRYEDDLRRDDAWLYLGFQRRVRRLATGQITDVFLGTDLMIEDFEGYNGRISDYLWEFKSTTNILLPFYNHNEQELSDQHPLPPDEFNPAGYRFVDLHGKGNCFGKHTWQLRKAYMVEARPADANHPISKRIFYMDAQTFTLPLSLIYDRAGKLWKRFAIQQAHPDHHVPANKGTGVSLDNGFSMVDLQAQHCTTGQFRGLVVPKLNPVTTFSVQNMRVRGR